MPLPQVLLACVDDAVSRAGTMMENATDAAEAALEEERRRLENPIDRLEYTAALHELTLQRMSWAARFPEAVREALTNPSQRTPGALTVRPSSLSLVDDDEVMQAIETSRLTQQLASKVEQPLAELDALMSTALGLEGVQPEHNPMRPEIFAQALRAVLGEGKGASASWPALWMRHMSAPMSADLVELYRSASRLLRQARVEAAAYRVVTAPAPLARDASRSSQPMPLESQPMPQASQPAALGSPSRPGALADTSRSAAAPTRRAAGVSGFVEMVTQALRGPLFADFLFRGTTQEKHALEPSYYARIDEELAQLEQGWDEAPPDPEQIRAYERVAVVDRPVREVGTESPLSADVWGRLGAPRQRSLVRTRLKQQAQNVGQVMGLEVVRQLVDQVARDPRLLAPVREAIVALEPSLARLALKSPRFFGEEENPARKLVASVAERSFKYNDEFSSQFQEFFGQVSENFKALNELDALDDDQPFAFALEQMQAAWSEQDRQEEAQRAKLMQAVQFAEQRQHEAGQIAWMLGQRSDLEGVPAPVQDFLFGRWALVMAHARLTHRGHDIDPGGYGGVITDLLWTVKRDTVLRDPARAFELIPRVVMRLRAGLDLLGDAPSDNDEFFKALERLHRPVLKLRAKHRKQAFDIPSELPMPDADLAPAAPQSPPAQADELWLAPGELHRFGFEDTMPSDFADLEPSPAAARPSAPAADAAPQPTAAPQPQPPLGTVRADGLIAMLHVGCWVDLYSRNKWRRARLTWCSANAAFFMFESHGGRPHSMTKRSLQRLVVNRLLRPIESHEVVQHAIDHLAKPQQQALAA
jgi:hypothetical protein